MNVHVCPTHGSPPAHWLPGLHKAAEALWFEHVEGSKHWPLMEPEVAGVTQQTCALEQASGQLPTEKTRGQLASVLASSAHWPPAAPASARW